jgi:hypothetical protein
MQGTWGTVVIQKWRVRRLALFKSVLWSEEQSGEPPKTDWPESRHEAIYSCHIHSGDFLNSSFATGLWYPDPENC